MASDNSPTRNGIIVAIALGTIVALVGVKFALDSYFVTMTEASAFEKLASPEQLLMHREAEKKALMAGPMNIEQSISELTRRGRDGLSAGGVDLSPKQSEDTGPLTGWSKMPRALPVKPAPEAVLAPGGASPTDPHTGAVAAPVVTPQAPASATVVAPTHAPTMPHTPSAPHLPVAPRAPGAPSTAAAPHP
jgi:hypothetical protein